MAGTIDHSTLTRLVEAGAVRGAHIVGQGASWAVIVRYGMHERALAAQRTGEVRLFRKFETLVGYLAQIGISRFDVDAANYDATGAAKVTRPDRSEALKRVYEAARNAEKGEGR